MAAPPERLVAGDTGNCWAVVLTIDRCSLSWCEANLKDPGAPFWIDKPIKIPAANNISTAAPIATGSHTFAGRAISLTGVISRRISRAGAGSRTGAESLAGAES